MANALTLGSLTTKTTFETAGFHLAFTGDDNANASAALRVRTPSGSGTWENCLPLWRTDDGSVREFHGSALLLTAGTTYDYEITVSDGDGVVGTNPVVGTVTTRSENISSHAALSATTTRWADANNGSDSNAGTSSGAPWKTLDKVRTTAPSGAVVQLASGFYLSTGVAWANPMSFVGANPAAGTSSSGYAIHGGLEQIGINSSSRAVIEGTRGSAPTGAATTGDNQGLTVAPWVYVEPGTAGNGVYKWTDSGISSPSQCGYAATRRGEPLRIPFWKIVTEVDTAAEFADRVHDSDTNMPYGMWTSAADLDTIYVRLPGDLNPNSYYITLGTIGGIVMELSAADIRISGIEIRGGGDDVRVNPAADRAIIDRCILSNALNGIRFTGTSPSTYSSDVVAQDNLFKDSNLWDETGNGIPWYFVKGNLLISNPGSSSRVGENNETCGVFTRGGCKGFVFRRNTVDGYFNGLTGFHGGGSFDRFASSDWDIYDVLFRGIADDAMEPEDQAINWRMWNIRAHKSFSLLSTGPVNYGPLYLFRFEGWRQGGLGVKDAVLNNLVGLGFKFSASSSPIARLFVAHGTLWTDYGGAGSSGLARYASQGGVPESFWMRNVIMRMTRYAIEPYANSFSPGHWGEDYNIFVTADASRYMQYGGTNETTVAAYRTASGQGAHSNKNGGTDVQFNDEAAIDAILINTATGDLTLVSTAFVRNAGVAVPQISSRASQVEGAAPDLGATEYGLTAGSAPTAPSGLAATAISYQRVDLTWTDASSDETGFEVERAPDSSGSPGTYAQIGTPAANATSYSDTTVSAATTYWYRVRAVNGSGNSAYTTADDATTPTAPSARTAAAGRLAASGRLAATGRTAR